MKLLIAVLATVLAAIVAVALSFKSVHGAGINLAWDDCGAHGAELRKFACDTNEGSHTLVVSFVAPQGVSLMSSNEIVIDLESVGSSVPDWWRLRASAPAGCRAGSLTYNVDFTGAFNCYDYWQGAAAAAIVEDAPIGNRARIKGLVALPAGDPRIGPVPEGIEVYSFKAVIKNTKTAGEGACSGCGLAVCIVLNSVKITQPLPLGSIFLGNPDVRQYVSWQCEATPSVHGGCFDFSGCPTPALSRTWGQIKQFYR